ncbi:MAG: porin family protein [Elusimicrobia bacterium]|nr:porin family protein [Elusimicrobiota bacterium]
MKKLPLLLFAALAALAAPASAGKPAAGLKAGLNISTFVGSDADYGDSKISRSGLVAGGYLDFPVQGLPFLVQAELLISQKGALYKWDLLGQIYEQRVRLTYLELPVLARFNFETRNGPKTALLIGPSFAFKLSARGEDRTVTSSSSGNLDNIRGFDPGVVAGGLVEMETSRGAIFLEGRYTRGLSTIDDSSGSRADIKNSVASVLLGYRF